MAFNCRCNSHNTVAYLFVFVTKSFPFFFFNDTATTEIYTLSLHDALPISVAPRQRASVGRLAAAGDRAGARRPRDWRSEEHTSELQSRSDLVCRLLLEKKKKKKSKISDSKNRALRT